jgi:cytoskeleton protein RodZ
VNLTETQGLGVGRALAEARVALGLSHGDVAQQLKFMPRQLEAIEAERFESLPGPTIARGMVRTYARFLRLDPEPLLQRMAGHVEAPDATPQLAARFSQPVPFSDGGRRSTAMYLVLSAGVLAAAAAVLYEWRHEPATPPFVAKESIPEPARQTASLVPSPPPAPVAPVAPADAPAAKLEKPVAKVEKPVAKVEKPLANVEKPAPRPEISPAPGGESPAAAPKPVAGGSRLVLRFEEEAWVEVTDAAGRQLISSLNPAGTERAVRCAPPCSVVVGNAQHVRVRYNDREVDLQPHIKVEVARFTLK